MQRGAGVCVALLLALASLPAQRRGIEGKPAPGLDGVEWIQLPKGQRTTDIQDHRGKVVYLYFFQSWCPACHSHGFPMLQKMTKHYAGRDDVVFLAVQTVFEGHRTNTAARGKAVAVGKFKLKIPIGYDAGPKGKRSVILNRYRTGGTPWMVLVDKLGVVRFNDYGTRLSPKQVTAKIDALRKEPGLLGSKVTAKDVKLLTKEPWPKKRFTLLRWWTDRCPFCRDSLPALEALRKKHADLAVVGVYHAKPPRDVPAKDVIAWARDRKFRGPVAVDPGWKFLKELQTRGLPRRYTSVSVLLDGTGAICWFHPGPRLHRKIGGKYAKAAKDLRGLEGALGDARRRKRVR